nr:MAG TPA: AT hook containing protein [Caudoviricetes sp.]
MGRKRGRPKKDFGKKYVVTIRLSELDLNRLAFINGKEKRET